MSQIKDQNTTRQIQRMVTSLEDFIDAWNEVSRAWVVMNKECKAIFIMDMRSEVRRFEDIIPPLNTLHNDYLLSYFKELANSLEKEIGIVRMS